MKTLNVKILLTSITCYEFNILLCYLMFLVIDSYVCTVKCYAPKCLSYIKVHSYANA